MTVCVFRNFNHSVWHASWIVVPIGVFAYLISFFSLKKGHFYLFDPKHNSDPRLKDAGDYKDHYQRYQDLAKLVVTLSAAAIAFLINTHCE
jgi:phosphate/sulfate permease